ncbi:hypothetical protein ACWGOQ_0019420 [Aquimarina sp. M1]
METGILISIVGALSAVIVSLIGAWRANKNSILLQTRRLKEEHYIKYIEALPNNIEHNNEKSLADYVFTRDKLFIIASEDILKNLIKYEDEGIDKNLDHDIHLTELIKSIREDLDLTNKKISLHYNFI